MSKDGKLGAFASFDSTKLAAKPVRIKMFAPKPQKAIVADTAGRPLGGVTVALQAKEDPSNENKAVSDASGEVTFPRVYSGGTYYMSATCRGYCRGYSLPGPAVGAKGWRPVEHLKLAKADIVQGRAVDEQGKPLVGAEITVVGRGEGPVLTDSDGAFEIAVPPADDLENDPRTDKPVVSFLVEDKKNALGAFTRIDRAEPLKNGVVLVARPRRALTIVVRDTEGKPLRDVEVDTYGQTSDRDDSSHWLCTNSAGEAVLRRVYFGANCMVDTKLRGYYREEAMLPEPADGWKDRVEVVMERADRVQRGKVVDSSGKPVVGAKVTSSVNESPDILTGPGGAFTLAGLPASKVTLYASSGKTYGSAETNKDTPDVTIRLTFSEE